MRTGVRALIGAGLALGLATAASAGDKVSVLSDLRKWDRNEHRLWRQGMLPDEDVETPALGWQSSVTPGNPLGVAGFNGPPGFVGDSVSSYSPLPPGAPGNEEWW